MVIDIQTFFNDPTQPWAMEHLILDVQQAKRRLVVASAWLSDMAFVEAITASTAATKQFILNATDVQRLTYKHAVYEALSSHCKELPDKRRLDVLGSGTWQDGIMHHKFVVCDDVLWVGSFNFTEQAQHNFENMVRIEASSAAGAFAAEAKRIVETFSDFDNPESVSKYSLNLEILGDEVGPFFSQDLPVPFTAMLGACLPGDLLTIGGVPSSGKTTTALWLALRALQNKKRVAIWSPNMDQKDVSLRLLTALTKVTAHALKRAELNSEEWESCSHALRTLDNKTLFINDVPSLSEHQLYDWCRQLDDNSRGLDVLIIDSVDMLKSRNSKDGSGVFLKQLARELQCVVVSTVSLHSTNRIDNRPFIDDVPWSFVSASDHLWMNYRAKESADGSTALELLEFIVAKSRRIPTITGHVLVKWDTGDVTPISHEERTPE